MCGVNPVETYIRSGSYVRKPSFPYTPGSDVSGVVEAVGDGVHLLQVNLLRILHTEYMFTCLLCLVSNLFCFHRQVTESLPQAL